MEDAGKTAVDTIEKITPYSMEISKGDGAIAMFEEFKKGLAETYKDTESRPAIVEKLLSKSPVEIAKEYGYYKPGQELESAMLTEGTTIKIDDFGNFISESANGNTTILESTTGEVGNYQGEMFDYQAQPQAGDISSAEIPVQDQQGVDTDNIYEQNPENNTHGIDAEKIAQVEQITKQAMANDIDKLYGSEGVFGFGKAHGFESAIWKNISNEHVLEVLDSEPVDGVDMEEDWMGSMREYLQNIIKMEKLSPGANETVSQFIERAHKIRAIKNMGQ